MKKLLTLALGFVTLAVLTTVALAGATPWLNLDHAGSQDQIKDKNNPHTGGGPPMGGGGATPWLNGDAPGGAGDYELTKDHLKIACRFHNNVNTAITDGVPDGYHCSIPEGGWCKNNNPVGLRCADMEILYSWNGGVTKALNRDNPGGVGDYELTKDNLKIMCRFRATGETIRDGVPAGYHCSVPEGGWCKNNNPQGLKCKDMEVRFLW